MTHLDPIISSELPVIQRIIQDETWLEGERRGCFVLSGDPLVQEHVCQVILRIGQDLRQSVMEQFSANSGLARASIQVPSADGMGAVQDW
jgi:hypothetical protein